MHYAIFLVARHVAIGEPAAPFVDGWQSSVRGENLVRGAAAAQGGRRWGFESSETQVANDLISVKCPQGVSGERHVVVSSSLSDRCENVRESREVRNVDEEALVEVPGLACFFPLQRVK